MIKTIREICKSLETALLDGNINAIPENSLKIKQFLKNSALEGQKSTDYLERLKIQKTKILVRTVENYMTFMSKLRTFDLNEVNDGSEQFEVLIGERSLPYVWDYLLDTVFIDSKYSYGRLIIIQETFSRFQMGVELIVTPHFTVKNHDIASVFLGTIFSSLPKTIKHTICWSPIRIWEIP